MIWHSFVVSLQKTLNYELQYSAKLGRKICMAY